jgi:hypothetical protein
MEYEVVLLKKNILVCFMGFAILSIFNINHAFALDQIDSPAKLCGQTDARNAI